MCIQFYSPNGRRLDLPNNTVLFLESKYDQCMVCLGDGSGSFFIPAAAVFSGGGMTEEIFDQIVTNMNKISEARVIQRAPRFSPREQPSPNLSITTKE